MATDDSAGAAFAQVRATAWGRGIYLRVYIYIYYMHTHTHRKDTDASASGVSVATDDSAGAAFTQVGTTAWGRVHTYVYMYRYAYISIYIYVSSRCTGAFASEVSVATDDSGGAALPNRGRFVRVVCMLEHYISCLQRFHRP